MKISVCSVGWRRTDRHISEIIPRVSALGFDGIELWGRHLVGTDATEIASALEENSLPVSMISPYFDLTGDDAARALALDDAAFFIDYADAVGAPLIRVFTGVVGSREASSDQFKKCVGSLRNICDRAAEKGLTLALETHPKTLVDTAPGCLELLEAVDRDNIKLNLDIYHMWEVHFDPVAVLEWLFDHVAHVHAKNAIIPPNSHYPLLHDRQALQEIVGVTPLANGNMPYAGFLRSLRAKGFDRYVSVEWFGPDVDSVAAGELSYLRAALTE